MKSGKVLLATVLLFGATVLVGSAQNSEGIPPITADARNVSSLETVRRPLVSHTIARAKRIAIYTLLHNFTNYPSDGAEPMGSLVAVNGALYGTTNMGGSTGLGTVFRYSLLAQVAILHNLGNPPDGAEPQAGLANFNGLLYGTTYTGGPASCQGFGCGVVYAIAPSGSENLVYGFKGGFDGAFPATSGLTSANGNLYGATREGGNGACRPKYGCGVVFSITPSGVERVVHRFSGQPSDGAQPFGVLLNVGGTLYGTTQYGGTHGKGTVFSISPSGIENVLYSFKGVPDGAYPQAGVILVNGVLYGTTGHGGTSHNCNVYGCGTVYALKASGNERVLHSFNEGPDGAGPAASLIEMNGMLYGTTLGGGVQEGGVVFQLDLTGNETILHRFLFFVNQRDGGNPSGGLVDLNGTLYGTTLTGGTRGVGTIYSIRP